MMQMHSQERLFYLTDIFPFQLLGPLLQLLPLLLEATLKHSLLILRVTKQLPEQLVGFPGFAEFCFEGSLKTTQDKS